MSNTQLGNLPEEDAAERLAATISDMVAKLLVDKLMPDLVLIRDGLSNLSKPYQGKLLLNVENWINAEAMRRLSDYQPGKVCSSKKDLAALCRLEQSYPISERYIPTDSQPSEWKHRELMTVIGSLPSTGSWAWDDPVVIAVKKIHESVEWIGVLQRWSSCPYHVVDHDHEEEILSFDDPKDGSPDRDPSSRHGSTVRSSFKGQTPTLSELVSGYDNYDLTTPEIQSLVDIAMQKLQERKHKGRDAKPYPSRMDFGIEQAVSTLQDLMSHNGSVANRSTPSPSFTDPGST